MRKGLHGNEAGAIDPGFIVIHGNQLDTLRGLAVEWMRRHPLRPLENEVVLVQSNGIAQWLKLALAGQDGCCIAAALRVELPARFLWQAYRSVLGHEAIPQQSPLDKDALAWRLMRLLPVVVDDDVYAPLRRFLADDRDMNKRYQLAQRLADLFDQYQVYRADWLMDWADGLDRLVDGRGDARPLEAESRWQPALWRALIADLTLANSGNEGGVDVGPLAQSRAGIHSRFLQALAERDEAPSGLPRRISVFGLSSLPEQVLEALSAMARFSQVMLYVQNPCQHYWGDVVEDKDLLRYEARRQQRKPGLAADLGEDLHQHAQPLLAAWGKQGRDYINLLEHYDDPARYRAQFEHIDLFSSGPQDTLLGQLQDDILDLRPSGESRAHWPAVDPRCDASLRFHVAHSAQREVEILHDQLLACFNEDASLRPRDVIVMVPDVNAYAPHIQAVFGQFARDDARYIPFTLADQGLRGKQPLLIALEHLLRLPDSRFSVGEILDLLDVAALRGRFGIGVDDLPLLRRWLEGAGVRWGLDAAQRRELGLGEGLEQNTWRFGLRRMLLGYAMGTAGAYAGIEPYDEIGGLDAALIGPLSRLLDTLHAAAGDLARPAPPPVWGERLRGLLDDFFQPRDEDDDVLRLHLLEMLDGWLDRCQAGGLAESLPLAVVREAWLGGVDQGRLGQRFLAGSVNFCTLMPMRAIPFRMVCLLGMNDGDYPRAQPPLDFDLMARDYRPGDRSRREDDRYLMLEALLSARDRLYVSWVGRSIRDNSERPASVLVGQLRDHLADTWRLEGEGKLVDALTTVHPLQPFSRRYFGADPPLFSYAREWAASYEPAEKPAAGEVMLPPWQEEGSVELEQLQRFLRNPVQCFLNQRLKVFLDGGGEEAELDSEPFAVDALEEHQFKQELLQAAVHDPRDDWQEGLREAAERLRRSGRLPMAGFGGLLLDALRSPLAGQLAAHADICAKWPERVQSPQEIRVERGAFVLEGWLNDLRLNAAGERARVELLPGTVGINGKSIKWHRLLRPYIVHVAAAAQGLALRTFLVAEDTASPLEFAPLPVDETCAILDGWLEAWAEGMRRPLPVALKTAAAWLASSDDKAARLAYDGGDFGSQGEVAQSASLARCFPDFAALAADGTFAQWSERLYRPLLESLDSEDDQA
jgi:exodeoxyribonuclease V gamma subunit